MASYFDFPAQSNEPTAVDVPQEERTELQGMSLLSPQISRILDNLNFDDKSSSSESDEEGSSSNSGKAEESRLSDDHAKIDDSFTRKLRQGPSGTGNTAHGSKTSAKSAPKHAAGISSGTGTGDKSLKNPRSHMTRFQSLRSSLFQAHIENNMKQCHKEVQAREDAATNWKAQHEKRQGYNRPHTPEKASHEKNGFGRRFGSKIRRLTSKEPPTMACIEENTGNLMRRDSTASDEEDELHGDPWKPRQSYESSINHSDVDDLVRWVSRRDPPSDGERRISNVKVSQKEDSEHDSLGQSDIEELVHYASGKSISTKPVVPLHTGYSDESTASDSEQSQDEDDQDEESLSRWVSRRDGANAGPVRWQPSALHKSPDTENDSDVPEIGRWKSHHDDTSGESIAGSEVAKQDDVSVLEAARGRSRERSPRFEDKGHLKDDDVDDLVRWVSRRDSKQQNGPYIKDEAAELKRQEDEKKSQLGMSVDDKSLGPEDLDDLLAHVRGRQMRDLNSSITPAHV